MEQQNNDNGALHHALALEIGVARIEAATARVANAALMARLKELEAAAAESKKDAK